jgi:hypothetical protein
MMLLMTVEPGFGGQQFLDVVLPKLRRARAMVAAHGREIWLQVDGGVSAATIERCAEAGADVFVAGSAVYGADDPAEAVRALRAQAERATARAPWTALRNRHRDRDTSRVDGHDFGGRLVIPASQADVQLRALPGLQLSPVRPDRQVGAARRRN